METLINRLTKVQEDLNAFSLKLNKRSFKEENKITEKIEDIIKFRQCQDIINFSLTSTRDNQKIFKEKGNPSKADKSQVIRKNIYSLNLEINAHRIEKESLCGSIFLLITNLKYKDAKEFLDLYKYQPFLEKRHST